VPGLEFDVSLCPCDVCDEPVDVSDELEADGEVGWPVLCDACRPFPRTATPVIPSVLEVLDAQDRTPTRPEIPAMPMKDLVEADPEHCWSKS
jgi:hypothetical protein